MKSKEVEQIQKAIKFVISFGKFKGKELDKIPSGYLKWIAENIEDNEISTNADIVWRWRERMDCHWF